MDLLDLLAEDSVTSLVIPCTGKMFYKNIEGSKVLTIPLNKGYLESTDLSELLYFIDEVDRDTCVLVGGVCKIKRDDNTIIYRQRLFIHSITDIVKECAKSGIAVDVPPDFRVTVNSILNNMQDIPYLERYAKMYNESIDSYLKKTVLIQFYYLCKKVGVKHNLDQRYVRWANKPRLTGVLDYAPILCSNYNISKGVSALFYADNFGGDIFRTQMRYGYSVNKRTKHRKEGMFDAVTVSRRSQKDRRKS